MTVASHDFHHGVAAARAAVARGQRAEAERELRAAIDQAGSRVAATDIAAALNELAALRRDDEDAGAAGELLERALELLDGMPAPNDALLLLHTLSALGSVLGARAESARAELMLTRALRLGERLLGEEHQDLAGLLNDLSRLYLKAARFEAAEPLLDRLYAMKRRSKGDDHPEAATVLASLASVQESLGRHEEAEGMWRRVLAVREQTLAPNHFAIATALEHLAESCAARGKLAESVQLLRRAIAMREVTLGASHPSLRVARDRIADLRLQASDAALESFPLPLPAEHVPTVLPLVEPVAPLVRARIINAPAVPPSAPPAASASMEAGAARVSRGPLMASVASPVVASVVAPVVASVVAPVVATVALPADEPSAPPAFAFPELSQAVAFAEPNQADAVPEPDLAAAFPESNLAAVLHETTLSDIPEGVPHPAYERMMAAGLDTELEFGDDELDAEPEPRRRFAGAALLRTMRQRRPVVVFGIVAAALLIGAVALRARTNGELYASDYSTDAQREAALMAANSGVTPGQPPVARTSTAGSPAVPNHGAAARPTAPRTASNMQRVIDGDVTRSSDPTPSQPASAAPPKLIGNLDAIAGAVKAPTASLGESTKTTVAEAPKGRFDLGIADGSNELVRAQLIGAAPVPKFPEILRDRKIVGDVVVRFTVDAQGRPDPASISVIRTPHELMTEAVRRVIPSLRFEPAHKGRIGAPAEADQVQMAFQFNGATN